MSISSLPLIGITSSLTRNRAGSLIYQVGQAYVNAIEKAGGTVLILPITQSVATLDSLISQLDGIVFSGGGDIALKYFNGTPHPRVYGVQPERDEFEFRLLERVLASDIPLLAICRGIQILNVAFGGDLYTHIADQVEGALKHDWFPGYPRDKIAHSVKLQPNSKLHKVFNQDMIDVNSLHHQGIARVGDGLAATAFAPDGLVEGLEVKDSNFAVGVQWHPECLPNDPQMQNLFTAFISACLD